MKLLLLLLITQSWAIDFTNECSSKFLRTYEIGPEKRPISEVLGTRETYFSKYKEYHQLSDLDFSVLATPEDAQEVYALASKMEVGHSCAIDGCFARAYLVANELELKHGVKTFKSYLFPRNGNRVSLKFKYRIKGSSIVREVKWGYHVANVVAVNDSGKVTLYIIDPSTMRKAVPIEDWFKELTPKHLHAGLARKYNIFYENRYQYGKKGNLNISKDKLSGPSQWLQENIDKAKYEVKFKILGAKLVHGEMEPAY